MEIPLLQTKLYIPRPQPNHIPRPHLTLRIDEGVGRKLTLIAAPAGFGKTSLLSQWIEQSDRPVSWLSLDDDDNEVARFLAYFILALQKIDSQIGVDSLAVLRVSQSPQITALLAKLVNEIGAVEENFTLILDDYHVIKTPPIHDAINFLLDNSPPNMHLILASRADPFLPISRYRARGELVELRMEDLRFSPMEAEQYLNQVRELDLSEDDVLALDTRTEGWISGIHLAALSLEGQDEPSQFISDLTGDDRYIIDYLVDEVLAQRPKGTEDFLLKTSILRRMNPQLCDAVTGQDDGKGTLNTLDQANLFIVPLDNRRHWFRYHRLFADLLHQRLEETYSQSEIATLHQRASQWYEEKGFVFDAIEHSLAAKDYQSAIRMIEQDVERIFATGQLVPLTRFWDRFPQESLLIHPAVCMIFSWAWLATGHPQETEDCLRMVEKSIGVSVKDMISDEGMKNDLSPDTLGALVEVAVIYSQLALVQGDIAKARRLSQLALPLLEDSEGPYLYNPPPDSRTVAYFNLGMAHERAGELTAAERALTEALSLGKERNNLHIVSVAYGHLVRIHRLNGEIPRAIEVCEQGLGELSEMVGRSPMLGLLLSELGMIEYEQNNLKAAQDKFQEAIGVAKLWGFWEALVPGYFGLARIRHSQGNVEGAFQALDELETLGKNNPDMVMPVVRSSRALLRILEGDLDAAQSWAHTAGLKVDAEISYSLEGDYMLFARILTATDRWDEADGMIDQLISAAEDGERFGRLFELLILRAMSLEAQQKESAALDTITRALELGEPNSYVRVFLEAGERMEELLHRAYSHGVAKEYVSRLLRGFLKKGDGKRTEEDATPVRATPATALVEALSDRELDVLRMLRTELAGPEIAQELSIALSTMRTHTQSIYSKLNVSNRRAAVRKAEELNLF